MRYDKTINLLKELVVNMITVFMVGVFVYQFILPVNAQDFDVEIKQLTKGPKNHFFGYIGHVQTIPWNESGRYIVAMEVDFTDHMPTPNEAATVILIDTENDNKVIPIDKTHAWNFQQGTMFYWNPEAPETQFFFNDRDLETNKVFAVLYDIEKRERVKEYKYDDTPIGNSGVAQNGGKFLAINYGRIARLRPVTGYPEAYDWTTGINHPSDDGVFIIDVKTGEKKLLVSFDQLAKAIEPFDEDATKYELFINHTLWNREDNLIYFYVRAGYLTREKNVNTPCTIKPDGTELTVHEYYGGHPEWIENDQIIGSHGDDQIIYSIPLKKIVGKIGNPEILPKTGGDTALSPDGEWIAVSWKNDDLAQSRYIIFRRSDMAYVHTPPLNTWEYNEGELRVDPAPRWNRTSDALLVPNITEDGTRQLFEIKILDKSEEQ